MTNQIKKAFHVFPEHTNLPLFSTEEGEMVCYGHVPVEDFLRGAFNVSVYLTADVEHSRAILDRASEVRYTYAYISSGLVEDDEFRFTYCDHTREGMFPVTVLDIT